MDIALTPELENIIQEKVSSGLYDNAGEVVRDAIRQMNRYDQLFYAFRHEQLINALEEGEASDNSEMTIDDIITSIQTKPSAS